MLSISVQFWPNHPAAVKACEYINGPKKKVVRCLLPAQTSWFSTTTFSLFLLGDNQWKWYLLIQWHFQGIRPHFWGQSECASYHRQISETFETKPSNIVVGGTWGVNKVLSPKYPACRVRSSDGTWLSMSVCFATDRTCSWPPSESECSLHVSKTWD